MYNGNPHAPGTPWLDSIAGPGGYEEAEAGDKGTHRIVRDGYEYRITVVKAEVEPEEVEE